MDRSIEGAPRLIESADQGLLFYIFKTTRVFSVAIKSVCCYPIATTQLLEQFTLLHLAHPIANEPPAIPEPDALHVADCEEPDRLAVYECYFCQIKNHPICFLGNELFDHAHVYFLKMSADVK